LSIYKALNTHNTDKARNRIMLPEDPMSDISPVQQVIETAAVKKARNSSRTDKSETTH